jgi:NAD(P)-dependent dehydrogenase (short-subunit alcohol dehydrogenase family)
MKLELEEKVVLITGASRGIGRATALLFGEAGAKVAVNYHQSEAAAEEVVSQIGTSHALAVRADVGDPAAVEAMIEAVVSRFGRLDVLVNNAAVYEHNPFEGEDYGAWQAGWRRTFQVNVFGAANAAFLAMRVMRRQGGGRIVNIASRAAFRGETTFADYGASKAALVNLTRSIARGCAADGITSVCVAPGFIHTEMAASELAKSYEQIVGQVPLGRVGTIDDVAPLILFLSSPHAEYLNGTTVDVNGGSWFH